LNKQPIFNCNNCGCKATRFTRLFNRDICAAWRTVLACKAARSLLRTLLKLDLFQRCARVLPAAANFSKRCIFLDTPVHPRPLGDRGVELFINSRQWRLPLEELHVGQQVTMFQMSSQYPVGKLSGPTTGRKWS
jgi:hypothetical protein